MAMELKYPLWLLCHISGVSRSSYYKYKNRPIYKDDIEDIIIDIYNKSNKRAGYRTIKYILRNQYKRVVNHKKIQRIMREHDIASIVRRKRKRINEQEYIKENILNRDFKATKPGEKYVTDITYIPTQNKMMYLSVIIDLFDNYPVAWNISDKQDKSLSIDTIKILSQKYDLQGSIIHSDRGVHYTNKEYIDTLSILGMTQSMSRKGNCWDNAVAESFFSQYKCECIYLSKGKIKKSHDVKEISEEYIDYYTNFRPQKKLGGMPPSLYRKTYANV